MVVLRDGKRVQVTVTLERRREAGATRATQPPGDDRAATLGGLTVRDLTRRGDARSSAIEAGVRVTEVADGSVAEDKGIQPNDVIER